LLSFLSRELHYIAKPIKIIRKIKEYLESGFPQLSCKKCFLAALIYTKQRRAVGFAGTSQLLKNKTNLPQAVMLEKM